MCEVAASQRIAEDVLRFETHRASTRPGIFHACRVFSLRLVRFNADSLHQSKFVEGAFETAALG